MIHKIGFHIVSIFLLLLINLALVSAKDRINIAISQNIEIESDRLKLKDILDRSKTDPEFYQEYGDLYINVQGRNLNTGNLLLALESAGADLRSIYIEHPKMNRLRSVNRHSSKAKIALKIKNYLKTKYFINPIRLDLIQADDKWPLQNSYDRIRIKSVDVESFPNHIEFDLYKNRNYLKSISLKFKVQYIKAILVPKKDYSKNEQLTLASFHKKKVPVLMGKRYLDKKDFEDSSHFLAKKIIHSGKALEYSELSSVATMSKGDVITLIAGDQRFSVKAVAKVIEIKNNGRAVLVENLQSKKTVLAKPINQKEARVVY